MKKAIFLVLTVVFCFALASVAFAHSGGTDSRGGHRDRSTGEYHYHHGYSAHQHEDLDGDGDIDCPFNFVDKTNRSTGGSPGRSNTPIQVYTPKPNPTPTPTPEPTTKNQSFGVHQLIDCVVAVIVSIVFGISVAYCVLLVCGVICIGTSEKKQNKKNYVPGAQKALDAYLDEKNRK